MPNFATSVVELTPPQVAIFAAILTAFVGLLSVLLTAFLSNWKESVAWRRQLGSTHVGEVRESYAFVLSVLSNGVTGNMGDRVTQGKCYAEVQLLGSPLVRQLYEEYRNMNDAERRSFDLKLVCDAMRTHLSEIELQYAPLLQRARARLPLAWLVKTRPRLGE